MEFLKASVDAHHKANGKEQLNTTDFVRSVRALAEELGLNAEFLKRGVNEGFSGGEKKRNEILQLKLLNPELAILDETDSGLDIDALKVVAKGINDFRSDQNAILLITHYQRLLDYIVPDYVHVLAEGKIVQSGDKKLALELEQKGLLLAQLEFQDLPVSPWLGLNSDELVKTMNQKVRQTSFKERWKYTSAKKAFNLNLEAMERMPDFGGSTQPGVTISDKPNPRILRLTSHKIINEKY